MTASPDDDDLLAGYDLSAWDVPPPPVGLVDVVIERARQPAPVAALDSGERMHPRRSWRWWVVGATAAAVAVVAILVGVWGVQRPPADEQGEVSAQAARTLAIGPTTAALDPGTTVRWRRDKHRIAVAQPRGSAMWKVAAEDSLVIDAGAMVASVEASGASLRVEVEMINASDTRAVGISAATAIAVALVTIVVYEGTVRVRHGGQTVNVAPGARYEVRPPSAPEPFAVGGGTRDEQVRALEERIKQLEAERDSERDVTTCDEASCVLNNYAGDCCAVYKAKRRPAQLDESIDRAAITATMSPLTSEILACPAGGFVGTVKARIAVGPNGRVTSATTSSTSRKVPSVLASCIEDLARSAVFPRTVHGGTFTYPYVYAAAPPCNPDALRQKGDDHLQTGMDAAALASFEAAMRCRPDPTLFRRAFLAACRSKNAAKARVYYAKLPDKDRSSLSMMCIRNGITLDDEAPAPCDAAALSQEGDDALQEGLDATALAAFQAAIACKPSPELTRRAYVAACRSKNASAANTYYAQLPDNLRSSLAQICIRYGILVPAETGVIKVASTPAARIFLDGVDTGKTTPATLSASAGDHKITLSVAGDKFTWPVVVKAGKTVSLTKVLE